MAFVASSLPSSSILSAPCSAQKTASCTQASLSVSFVPRKNSIATFEGFKSTRSLPSFRYGDSEAVSFDSTRKALPQSGGLRIEMANLREIRDRIASVKNTQKITTAMRLVAAAKVRRAQETVLQTRPFTEEVVRVLFDLNGRLKLEDANIPLLTPRPVQTVGLLLIGGDRGLCGGFNAFNLRSSLARIKDLQEQGLKIKLIIVGKKALQYFGRRKFDIVASYPCGNTPDPNVAYEVANLAVKSYLSEEFDRVEILFTKFVSLIASKPSVQTLLPLDITGIEAEADEIFRLTTKEGQFAVERKEEPFGVTPLPSNMIFEQDPITIVNFMLPLYINSWVYRTFAESLSSELAARMTAMSAASDNAKALAKDLTLNYNRARQAAITQSILEVVSGANAGS